MAEIDHAAFAATVSAELARRRLSFGLAVLKWPATNKAMWSRATRGQTLSAGNYLLVCRLLRISPWRFWRDGKARRVTMKTIVKQAVTAAATRETVFFSSRAKGAPAGRPTTADGLAAYEERTSP